MSFGTVGNIPLASELLAAIADVDRLTWKRRTSDGAAVNNSTTLVSDSEIVLPGEASTTYAILGRGIYTSNSTADYKIGWSFPTGLTMDYSLSGIAAGTSARDTYTNVQTDTPTLEGAGVSTKRDFWILGLVFFAGTAGDLVLRTAQSTANASDSVLKANSFFMMFRLP